MKKSTHNPTESFEQQHYSKKYITRQLEEKDAERQIREYMRRQGDTESEPSPVSQTPKVS